MLNVRKLHNELFPLSLDFLNLRPRRLNRKAIS